MTFVICSQTQKKNAKCGLPNSKVFKNLMYAFFMNDYILNQWNFPSPPFFFTNPIERNGIMKEKRGNSTALGKKLVSTVSTTITCYKVLSFC